MPEPGSHKYDIKRARLREQYEHEGINDQHADQAANEQLQESFPLPRDEETGQPAGQRTPGPAGAKGVTKDDIGGGIDVRSSTFVDHDIMPMRCSRDSDNVSPELEWNGVPEGTAEIAVLCEDPDALRGPAVHWLVSRLPPDCTGLAEGDVPANAQQSRNAYGRVGWDGPQPAVGEPEHRYFFRVYAASRPLELDEDAGIQALHRALQDNTAAHGTMVGLYQR